METRISRNVKACDIDWKWCDRIFISRNLLDVTFFLDFSLREIEGTKETSCVDKNI